MAALDLISLLPKCPYIDGLVGTVTSERTIQIVLALSLQREQRPNQKLSGAAHKKGIDWESLFRKLRSWILTDFKSTSVFDLFLLLFLREPGPGDIEGDKGRKKINWDTRIMVKNGHLLTANLGTLDFLEIL